VLLVLVALAGLLVGVGTERALGRERVEDPGSARPRRTRRRSWKRRLGITAVVLVVVLLATGIGGWVWANRVFDRIEKVDVGTALGHGGSGTNYLLVGADNGPDSEAREGISGMRSDTIMILNIDGSRARMLSLNRDLWLKNPATGEMGRINATYRQGPENLIRAITDNYGIPIDRYIEIDFSSFAGLVDAFGGIDIPFEHPAFDVASGLDVRETGLVHLDGDQALAYVRSRHYVEVIDGEEVPDLTSDLGRVQRQQVFLRAIMAKNGDTKNPVKLLRAASKMSGGLRIDHRMTMLDAARFAWRMGKLNPETVVLPVEFRRTSGGASVLELGEGAEAILATFR